MNSAEPRGIDVSHWQEEVDWGAVASDSVVFVFMKATESTQTDERFEFNWAKSREAGLVRGAYHFFSPATPVAVQVDDFRPPRSTGSGRSGGTLRSSGATSS